MTNEVHPVVERARQAIEQYEMLAPGEKVLVAVSGGGDSICLLRVLQALGYFVEVAHFDHLTRNGASSEDADFVREIAKSLGLSFHIETCDVEAEAKSAGRSFEELGRELRYTFFCRIARDRGCGAIATGHHADDQAETILMRLLRGAGTRGLSGIPPVRVEGGIDVIRPLIHCMRDEIEGFLHDHGYDYRTDVSNMDTSYQRNKVRHELIPYLVRNYNPQVRSVLLRLSEVLRVENEYVEDMTTEVLEDCLQADGSIYRKSFSARPLALQRRAIQEFARRNGVLCPFERVTEAVEFVVSGATGKSYDLGGGIVLRNSREMTEVCSTSPLTDESIVALNIPCDTVAFDKQFRVRCMDEFPQADLAQICSPELQLLDADKVGEKIIIRRRRDGDRFRPYGMTGTKKLKDYFIDLGLPMSERDRQLLMVANDEIVWVVGRAIGAQAAVTPHTERVLEVLVSDAPEQ